MRVEITDLKQYGIEELFNFTQAFQRIKTTPHACMYLLSIPGFFFMQGKELMFSDGNASHPADVILTQEEFGSYEWKIGVHNE